MNKTPAVRFKGFSDEWEQRKLGNLGTLKNGMNFSKDAMGIGFPFVNLQDIFGKSIIDADNLGKAMATPEQLRDYNLIAGDVLFVRSSVKLEGVGETALVEVSLKNTTYSGFIIRFRDETGLDSNFKKFVFATKNVRKQILSQTTDSANKNISQTVLSNLELYYPAINEQKAIGVCFSYIDNLITRYQCKYEKLKNIKKSMLYKMFPQNGRKVPEIRFAGFTGDWEQRKLSEMGEVITGSTPSTQHPEYYSEDGIPWVTPTDITENVISDTPRKLSSLGAQVGRVVPAETILVTCIASIGKNTMLANTGSFNQQINGLVPNKQKFDPYFLLTESYHWSVKMKREAAAGTMQIVNKNEFSAIETFVPELPEQRAIGSYFKEIDNLITLHQRKLEKLKQLKQAMLYKMFV